MEKVQILKAIADSTRLNILELLLKHNYCVRALAKELQLSEAAISQHLKVLKEAGLIKGEKRGYFMHYEVDSIALKDIAKEIKALTDIKKEGCKPTDRIDCPTLEKPECPKKGECSAELKAFCHGRDNDR